MRITTGLSGALLVVALAVSGCGGDSEPESTDTSTAEPGGDGSEEPDGPSDAKPIDVCALLSPADLQQQFDSPFDDGDAVHQEQTGADQCVWTNTDVPPVKTFSVTVLRQGAIAGALEEGGVTVESLHEASKAALGDVEVLDLGDDAFLSGTTLAVLDGDTEYTFNTFLGDSPEAIAGMKALAAKVVG